MNMSYRCFLIARLDTAMEPIKQLANIMEEYRGSPVQRGGEHCYSQLWTRRDGFVMLRRLNRGITANHTPYEIWILRFQNDLHQTDMSTDPQYAMRIVYMYASDPLV
jgi:hypothetical protein